MSDSEKQSNAPNNSAAASAAVGIALVALVFSLVVAVLLIYEYRDRVGTNPHEASALLALKEALKSDPTNESLKEQIRELDLHFNKELDRQKKLARLGAVMLLGGVIVFLAAASATVVLRRTSPMPPSYAPPSDLDVQTSRAGTWAIGVLACVVILVVLALFYQNEPHLAQGKDSLLSYSKPDPIDEPVTPQPTNGGGASTAPENGNPPPATNGGGENGNENGGNGGETPQPTDAVATPTEPASTELYDPPSPEDVAKNWPRFRGPEGAGHSKYDDVPIKWDAASGENIRWKSPVPLPGNNSPVVWGDRIFLSGATKDRRQVYCYDAKTGKLLWQQDIQKQEKELRAKLDKAMAEEDYEKAVKLIAQVRPPEPAEDTGFAAPTLATDGHRVFAMFGSGDMAAIDFEGRIAWERKFPTPINCYGHAASLATYGKMVFVQLDQGGKKDDLSKLYALSVADGLIEWSTPREVPNSWTSPIVAEVGGKPQLITSADPWVIAYDVENGNEIWQAKAMRQDVGPSPICHDGVVYVANEFPAACAIQADGEGDVTETKILWSVEDSLPDTCSPLVSGDFFLILASYGVLTCYDRKTGEMLWEQDFDDDTFNASPSLVGNRIFLVGKEDAPDDELYQKTYVMEFDKKGAKIVAENKLGESCVASPAFQPGCIYMRGDKHLFCIGKK